MQVKATIEEAAASHYGTAIPKVIEPARTLRFPHRYSVNGEALREKQLAFDFGQTHLWELSASWSVWSEYGILFSPSGKPVQNAFSFPDPSEFQLHLLKARQSAQLTRKRHVQGALFVFTNVGADNYFHVLSELAPRLKFLPIDLSPSLLIKANPPSFVTELLERLVPDVQLIELSPEAMYTADALFVTDWNLNFIPERYAWLRSRFVEGSPQPRRKIFVTRHSGSRKLKNAEETESVFKNHGFEIVEPETMTVAAQAALFSEASVVAGPHGAGLSNLIWTSGADTIEIRPAGWENRSLYHHALACGCRNYLLIETNPIGPAMGLAPDPFGLERILKLYEKATALG